MSYEIVAITVLWTFLFGYLLIGSIDFGAGFFSFYSVLTGHQNKIHNIIQRYLSPVWEVTNVFLIFLWWDWSASFPTRPTIMARRCSFRAVWRLFSLPFEGPITPTTPTAPRSRTTLFTWRSTELPGC